MNVGWILGSAIVSFAIAAILGKWLVPFLKKLKYGQTILDIGPKWHKGKRMDQLAAVAHKAWPITLATGRREIVANFKGSNSAPAWSPDGSQLAVQLDVGVDAGGDATEHLEHRGVAEHHAGVALLGADDATVEDFWAAIVAKYGYDISDDGINAETAGTSISSCKTEGASESSSYMMQGYGCSSSIVRTSLEARGWDLWINT